MSYRPSSPRLRPATKSTVQPSSCGPDSLPAHRNQIPDTNAAKTNLLWKAVLRRSMSGQPPNYSQSTNSSRQRATRAGQARHISSIHTPPSNVRSSTISSLTQESTLTVGSKSNEPRVTDKSFRDVVFDRYGVSISDNAEINLPHVWFQTQDPEKEGFKGKVSEWYRGRHENCHIWLSLDKQEAQKIAQQYTNMLITKTKEAKFSYRGKLYFFKEDDVYGPGDEDRCSSAYLELGWAPNPDNKRLFSPPKINEVGVEFGFRTNPDCTYWLTTRRMISDYRALINVLTFVLPNAAATAPYLTVEFKKDNASFDVALNQLAVSATLILYNRFHLRRRRLEAFRSTLDIRNFQDIKHYAIAFNGGNAWVYVANPQLSSEGVGVVWRGCELNLLGAYDATVWKNVIDIQCWINEIHNWGIGEFSKQLLIDIKGILWSSKDGKDRILLLPDEMEALGLSQS